VAWLPAAAVAVALLTIPHVLAPEAGLDPSWRMAMHVGAALGLTHGTDILFTYGPLGFLVIPGLWEVETARVTLLYTVASQAALAFTLLYGTRTTLRPVLAVPVAYVVALVPVARGSLLLVIVFCWCALLLTNRVPPRAYPWLLAVGGVLIGVELLIQFGPGVISLALAGVTTLVVARGRRLRAAAALALWFVTTVVVLWSLSGGALGGLPTWVRASLEVAGGYVAMAEEEPGRQWEYLLALLLLAVFAVLFAIEARRLPRGRWIPLAVLTAGFVWVIGKHAFVRHAGTHSLYFFSALAVTGLVVMGWSSRVRWPALAAVVGTVATVLVIAELPSLPQHLNPLARASALGDQLVLATSATRARSLQEDARVTMQGALGLDERTLRELAGQTVHVSPYETSAVWAHRLRWRPVPMFQAYTAYTPRLDEQNARMLASPDAPGRILRERVESGIDGRNANFESPAYLLSMLCHYRESSAGDYWQVLAKGRSRCGAPRRIASVRSELGESIRVPAREGRDELVFARVHLPETVADRLFTFLFKPSWTAAVELDESDSQRLVKANAEGPLVMRVPPAIGYSPSYDGRLDTDTLRFEALGRRFFGGSGVAVDFFAVPVAPD
jgi:hypothetical protein